MAQNLTANRVRTPATWLQRRVLELGRHWLAWANLFWGAFVVLPWLAPILMKIGATGLGLLIYTVYSPLCHQFVNRSFFLFGPQPMYSYAELLPYAPGTGTPLGLKAFIGTPELGYKVAWSDRMVSMYGGILLGGLIFALVRRHLRASKWWLPVLMAVPMVLDGITHTISDLAGIGQGFRYNNGWLASLTGNLRRAFMWATRWARSTPGCGSSPVCCLGWLWCGCCIRHSRTLSETHASHRSRTETPTLQPDMVCVR